MREKNRNSIGRIIKFPQFTTMNVIDVQAGLVLYSSLIFYSLTIDNILNIVVLLILAGVSIMTLTGDNGLLNRTTSAKEKTEQAGVMENIRLAFQSAQIGEYAGEYSGDAKFVEEFQKDLRKVYNSTQTTVRKETNGTYTVNIPEEGKYTVSANGSVTKKSGVIIETKLAKIKKDEEKTVTARLDGVTGTITWESSAPTIISVTSDGKIKGLADSGKATITAYIEGTENEDSFTIDIAQKITGISASNISVLKDNTAQIEITTTPSGTVEDMEYTYTSGSSSIATVDEVGVVTGVAVGETTITITSKADNTITTSCTVTVTRDVGYFKTVEVEEGEGEGKTTVGKTYYYASASATTGTEITASNLGEYLGREVKYTPGNAETNTSYGTSTTYRLFYIDLEAGAKVSGKNMGKYGDGQGTIYLKADCDSKNLGWSAYTEYDKGESEDSSDSRATMFKLNPGMNSTKVDDVHDCGVAWMTDPEQWKDWKDATITLKSNNTTGSGINYVVGGPSLEMYVDSYNAYLDAYTENNVVQIYKNGSTTDRAEKLACEYVTSGYNSQGYRIGFAGTSKASWANTGYYQAINSLFAYNSSNGQQMYNPGSSKSYWLASPSADSSNFVMEVFGYYSHVSRSSCDYDYASCPLVSIKSGVSIQEK